MSFLDLQLNNINYQLSVLKAQAGSVNTTNNSSSITPLYPIFCTGANLNVPVQVNTTALQYTPSTNTLTANIIGNINGNVINGSNITLTNPTTFNISIVQGISASLCSFTTSSATNFILGDVIVVKNNPTYNGNYIFNNYIDPLTKLNFLTSTNPTGNTSQILNTGLLYKNVGTIICNEVIANYSTLQNLNTTTLTFNDGSSQQSANNTYITGSTSNIAYPIAMLGSASTGRTGVFTDSASHINYNPNTNLFQLNNNGKLTLNGTSSVGTFNGTGTALSVPNGTLSAPTITGTTLTLNGASSVGTFNGTGTALSVPNGSLSAPTITNTTLSTNTIQRTTAGDLTIQNNATGKNIYNVLTTSDSHSFRANNIEFVNIASDLTTYRLSAFSSNPITYNVPASQSHIFQVNSVENARVNSTGLVVDTINSNIAKDIVLNTASISKKISFKFNTQESAYVDENGLTVGVSKTLSATNANISNLSGNLNVGGYILSGVNSLENSISLNYRVPTSYSHSFQVNSVEKTKVDVDGITSSGLTIGTLNIPTGSLVAFNTVSANPYTTTFPLPTNALSLVYACIPQPTQVTGNWFALTVVTGSSVGAASYFYPIVSNNMVIGASGAYFTISNSFPNVINANVRFNVIKLV
jgi:hypothetical protein